MKYLRVWSVMRDVIRESAACVQIVAELFKTHLLDKYAPPTILCSSCLTSFVEETCCLIMKKFRSWSSSWTCHSQRNSSEFSKAAIIAFQYCCWKVTLLISILGLWSNYLKIYVLRKQKINSENERTAVQRIQGRCYG